MPDTMPDGECEVGLREPCGACDKSGIKFLQRSGSLWERPCWVCNGKGYIQKWVSAADFAHWILKKGRCPSD